MKMIRAYHVDRGRARTKVLIPASAHGTNPASAALCGYSTCRRRRQPDRPDRSRRRCAAPWTDDVAALMITNPNTLGLFEREIAQVAEAVHARGGLVYLDGANLNALMGVAKPAHMGADVMQINLHKTFSTPHGGGGPGAGPVARARAAGAVPAGAAAGARRRAAALERRLPARSIGRVRAFHGNFGMLVRAYAYILALGGDGLTQATRMAVLSANYIRRPARRRPTSSRSPPSACTSACSPTRASRTHGVKTLDIAKRLLDYGFYAPTIYFPLVVSGALMIEPTETESKETLDEFIDAMLRIAAGSARDARPRAQRADADPDRPPRRSARRAPAGAAVVAGGTGAASSD